VCGSPAHGQPVDPQKLAIAQDLYEQGLSALARAEYALACPKLEEVTRILPKGVGGLIALAHCYEGAGRLASAWTTYVVAQGVAAEAAREAEEKDARARAEALKPKLARLTIGVSRATNELPSLRITRDGTPLGAAQLGTPLPVDKGEHRVVATAEGRERWETTVEVSSDGANVTVEVPNLRDAATATAESEPPPVTRPFSTGVPSLPPPGVETPVGSMTTPPRRIAGAVVLGSGAAALVVGAIAGALVLAQHGSLLGACPGGWCPPAEKGDLSAYHAKGLTSTVGFVAGGALVVTGLLLLVVPPKRAASLATQGMRF
jgi:hypothetical protein